MKIIVDFGNVRKEADGDAEGNMDGSAQPDELQYVPDPKEINKSINILENASGDDAQEPTQQSENKMI